MSISREERKSDSYSRVRQAVLDAVAHTYGDVSLRRIAWDLSARLHTPAYKIFRCCMELSEQGEISIIQGRTTPAEQTGGKNQQRNFFRKRESGPVDVLPKAPFLLHPLRTA